MLLFPSIMHMQLLHLIHIQELDLGRPGRPLPLCLSRNTGHLSHAIIVSHMCDTNYGQTDISEQVLLESSSVYLSGMLSWGAWSMTRFGQSGNLHERSTEAMLTCLLEGMVGRLDRNMSSTPVCLDSDGVPAR